VDTVPDFPDYNELNHLLFEAGVTTSAAEAHGVITGVLCAPQGARVMWQELILGREGGKSRQVPEPLAQQLAALHRSTHALLSGTDCDFTLLLPDDDCSLADQIEGLTDWCHGYLFGLRIGGVDDFQKLPGDAGEVVRDIAHFSEAVMDSSLAGEEEAKALVEVVEYLRVGVQLVFEEWQAPAMKH
jgi:hypothetical protein